MLYTIRYSDDHRQVLYSMAKYQIRIFFMFTKIDKFPGLFFVDRLINHLTLNGYRSQK